MTAGSRATDLCYAVAAWVRAVMLEPRYVAVRPAERAAYDRSAELAGPRPPAAVDRTVTR